MTFEILQRTHADLDRCIALLRIVHERQQYPIRWPSDSIAWLSPDGLLGAWILEADGHLAGHVVLRRSTLDDGVSTGEIARLFVGPDVQGTGIGKALLDHAVREAWAHGFVATLRVVPEMGDAATIYEHLGWRRLSIHLAGHGLLAEMGLHVATYVLDRAGVEPDRHGSAASEV